MIFNYRALDRDGKSLTDHIDAPSLKAAQQKIRTKNLFLVSIQEASDFDTGKSEKKGKNLTRRNAVRSGLNSFFSRKMVGIFFRQLATLLRAGMPLTQALYSISEQIDNSYFRQIITHVRTNIEEGNSLSDSLARHPGLFSEMHINMIKVGENLGSLDQVVERLASIEQKRNSLKNKIQAALYYPLFMLLFALLVMGFLMVKIVPAITDIFKDQKIDLPLPTRMIIALSDFLEAYWILIPLILLGLFYFYIRLKNTDKGRERIDNALLTVPFIKSIYCRLMVMRFTQNMGVLLANRVDMLKSFEIVKKIINNSIIEKDITMASKLVKEGSSLSKAFSNSEFLPKLVIGMIAAGEASDTVDGMLVEIGSVYENELDLTITSLTSLLEPVIIIIMGFLIGFIVMSIMLPMMEMNLLVQ